MIEKRVIEMMFEMQDQLLQIIKEYVIKNNNRTNPWHIFKNEAIIGCFLAEGDNTVALRVIEYTKNKFSYHNNELPLEDDEFDVGSKVDVVTYRTVYLCVTIDDIIKDLK